MSKRSASKPWSLVVRISTASGSATPHRRQARRSSRFPSTAGRGASCSVRSRLAWAPLKTSGQTDSRGARDRRQAAEHAGERRDRHRKREHPPVERNRVDVRQTLRPARAAPRRSWRRQAELRGLIRRAPAASLRSTAEAHSLPLRTPSAMRRASSPSTRRRARERQVRDVRAGEQKKGPTAPMEPQRSRTYPPIVHASVPQSSRK